MKIRKKIHLLCVLAAAFVAAASARSYAYDLDNQSKSFSVKKGGVLEVSVAAGNIKISTWDKDEVSAVAEGIDREDIDCLKMTQSGNTVRVDFHPSDGSSRDLQFRITVPSQFDIDVKTSGGNIEIATDELLTGKVNGATAGGNMRIGTVMGSVELRTEGGNIRTGRIQGDAKLHTSGGEIDVAGVTGEGEANTAGGNILIENVGKSLVAKTGGGNVRVNGEIGGRANISTAGGDITVGKVGSEVNLSTAGGNIRLQGGNGAVKARTAAGNIEMRNVIGSLKANTAAGNIEADLVPSGDMGSNLSTAVGNVVLSLPESAKVTITARVHFMGGAGARGDAIRSDFEEGSRQNGKDDKEVRAEYLLNGGGQPISLETTIGKIEIRKIKK
jgi:DUF4097 and DUF4098 domain-containing protein YvlB